MYHCLVVEYAPGTKVYLKRPIQTNVGHVHPPNQAFYIMRTFRSRKLGLALEEEGDVD